MIAQLQRMQSLVAEARSSGAPLTVQTARDLTALRSQVRQNRDSAISRSLDAFIAAVATDEKLVTKDGDAYRVLAREVLDPVGQWFSVSPGTLSSSARAVYTAESAAMSDGRIELSEVAAITEAAKAHQVEVDALQARNWSSPFVNRLGPQITEWVQTFYESNRAAMTSDADAAFRRALFLPLVDVKAAGAEASRDGVITAAEAQTLVDAFVAHEGQFSWGKVDTFPVATELYAHSQLEPAARQILARFLGLPQDRIVPRGLTPLMLQVFTSLERAAAGGKITQLDATQLASMLDVERYGGKLRPEAMPGLRQLMDLFGDRLAADAQTLLRAALSESSLAIAPASEGHGFSGVRFDLFQGTERGKGFELKAARLTVDTQYPAIQLALRDAKAKFARGESESSSTIGRLPAAGVLFRFRPQNGMELRLVGIGQGRFVFEGTAYATERSRGTGGEQFFRSRVFTLNELSVGLLPVTLENATPIR